MNKIRVFNPEHDLALANGNRHFIAPQNIREMARDLAPLLDVMDGGQLIVWGWDSALKKQLLQMGMAEELLPTDAALDTLRTCSARKAAHHLLSTFRATHPDGPYTGESIITHDIDTIAAYATRHGHIILKDPLSSSGKGLRHVKEPQETHLNPSCEGGLEAPRCQHPLPCGEGWGGSISSWANALIKRHGYLTAEPYYNKVQDFAMEFCVSNGQCRFIGYSLFNTNHHGRYESNLLMEDAKIEDLLAQYVPHSALHEVQAWVISHSAHIIPTGWDTTKHPLHFGIDMMVVETTDKVAFEREQRLLTDSAERSNFNEVNGQQTTDAIRKANFQFSILNSQFRIHPCVEINLRLNMGIIAHEVRRQLLAPGTEGTFHVTAFPTEEAACQFHQEHTTQYPPIYREGKIVSGYHPLTPILPHTRHHAYILCR